MVNSEEFAKRLEKIMRVKGLTAAALAEEIDFNRSTISHLLSGRNKPSLEFVIKLLQKFPEIEWRWLVFGKGSFPALTEKSKKDNSSLSKRVSQATDFFSGKSTPPTNSDEIQPSGKKIDRIVVFYEDGSFKNYEN